MEGHAGMSIRPSPVDPARRPIDSPGMRAHRRRWLWVLAAVPVVTALTAAGSWWHARAASARIRSIAVLPFLDMSHGKDQDWFGDGITDEMIDGLARIPGLRVAAHASAFEFKNQARDLHRIGEQLGVAAVLEGGIQSDGGRLRITAQLHRTDDGFQLWSVTFDRPANDAFSLQREMVRALAERIRAGITSRPEPRQPSPQAYDAYLEGRALFGRAGVVSVAKAAERFAEATRLDSDFALAWAWQSIANEYRVDDGLVRSNEAMPAARGPPPPPRARRRRTRRRLGCRFWGGAPCARDSEAAVRLGLEHRQTRIRSRHSAQPRFRLPAALAGPLV
jgi:TolB-like protein